MPARTLVKRMVIDGEEMVCVAPWLWETIFQALDTAYPDEEEE